MLRLSSVLLFCVALFGADSLFASRKFALIVGTNYKGSEISPLNLCEKDAEAMKQSIVKTGNFDAANVRVLLGNQVTRENLRASIVDWLAGQVKEGDQVFFFFAGHGQFMRDPGAKNGMRNFIVMFQRPHVSDDELSQWFGKLRTKKAVIILDCCFSGGIAKKGAATRGAANVPIPEGQDYAVLQDLEKVHFQNKVVISSADDNETAIEIGKPIEHGIFTYFFSKAILDADLNGDKNISAYEAFFKARNETTKLAAKANHKQVPQISGDASGFMFVAAAQVTPAPDPVLPPVPTTVPQPEVAPPITQAEPQNPQNHKTGTLIIKTTYQKGQVGAVTVYVDQNEHPAKLQYIDMGAFGKVAQITLTKVPSGVHNVTLKVEGYADQVIKTGIEPGGTTVEQITCGLAGKGVIAGKVYLENFDTPAEGFIVFINPPANFKATSISMKDGSFAFTGVTPGRYTVFLRGSGRALIKQYDQVVTVEGDRVTTLDIMLRNIFAKK
ncbi:MAG: caspase family protein [Leptospiraceae bacterium]|nr:caspase family protein [Leptospiraceae bacterium]